LIAGGAGLGCDCIRGVVVQWERLGSLTKHDQEKAGVDKGVVVVLRNWSTRTMRCATIHIQKKTLNILKYGNTVLYQGFAVQYRTLSCTHRFIMFETLCL
jgi:hypothetical protein